MVACYCRGGGLWELFETRPLADILQEMADGWNTIKRSPREARPLVGAYNSDYEL